MFEFRYWMRGKKIVALDPESGFSWVEKLVVLIAQLKRMCHDDDMT